MLYWPDPHAGASACPYNRRATRMSELYPILEFDPERRAMIEAARLLAPIDMPQRCVVCFFQDVLREQRERGRLRQVATLRSEIGEHPIFVLECEDGREVTV